MGKDIVMNKLKLILFYTLSFTWGIIMSITGSFIILALLVIGKKPELFHGRVYIQIGKNWGGCEMGCFFICSENSSLALKQHECGHGIQNILFGPFTPFLVSIPSALRYQLRERKSYKSMCIYDTIISLILIIIGVGVLIPGVIFNILPLLITGGLLMTYIVTVIIWLVFIETPKYKGTPWPDYNYGVWFERTATEWGEKLFPEK